MTSMVYQMQEITSYYLTFTAYCVHESTSNSGYKAVRTEKKKKVIVAELDFVQPTAHNCKKDKKKNKTWTCSFTFQAPRITASQNSPERNVLFTAQAQKFWLHSWQNKGVPLSRNVSTRQRCSHGRGAVIQIPPHVNPPQQYSKDPQSSVTHLKLGLMLPVDQRSHVLHNQRVCVLVCFVPWVQRVCEPECDCVARDGIFLRVPSVEDIFGCQVGLRWANISQGERNGDVWEVCTSHPTHPLKGKTPNCSPTCRG